MSSADARMEVTFGKLASDGQGVMEALGGVFAESSPEYPRYFPTVRLRR
jgi:hypothetical protein